MSDPGRAAIGSGATAWLATLPCGGDGSCDAKQNRGRASDAGRADGMCNAVAGPSTMRGYTLIEVIVAFAILALALTLLLGTLSGASRQVHWADQAGRAALHAQSLLDTVGVGQALQPGHRDGDFEDGRYRWALDVERWRDPALPEPATFDPAAPQLLQLTLMVRWGDGDDPRRSLQLRSLRLVTPNPFDAGPLP